MTFENNVESNETETRIKELKSTLEGKKTIFEEKKELIDKVVTDFPSSEEEKQTLKDRIDETVEMIQAMELLLEEVETSKDISKLEELEENMSQLSRNVDHFNQVAVGKSIEDGELKY